MAGAAGVSGFAGKPAQQAKDHGRMLPWRLWVTAGIAAVCGCLFGMDLGAEGHLHPGLSQTLSRVYHKMYLSYNQTRTSLVLAAAGIAGGVASMDGFLQVRV